MKGEERDAVVDIKAARVCQVDRKQTLLRVVDVERLIPDDHSARAIWEILGRLDLSRFYSEIKAVEGVAGRPAYDPRMMCCIWLYAYSEGEGLGREISRLCSHDPAYQWITAFQEINHHSLSDFRMAHKEALDELFTQVLGVLSSEGLIELKRVSHDGTKIKSYAGADTFRREDTLKKHLRIAEEQVKKLSEQLTEDIKEKQSGAGKRCDRGRKQRLEFALKELEKVRAKKKSVNEKEEARVSTTEPEARIMKQPGGGYAPSYNAQISTDMTEGIIVGVRLSNEGADYRELIESANKIEKTMGKPPDEMVVDGGCMSRENIIEMGEKGINLIGSFQEKRKITAGQMARRGIAPGFNPSKFSYDSFRDSFTCPAGKVMDLKGKECKWPGLTNYIYRAKASDCFGCQFKDRCCPQSKKLGRGIVRGVNHPLVEAFIKRMETEEAKQIYKQRGRWSEFSNCWIKEKFGLRKFCLRGMGKALIELLWACIAYNIKQWIRLRWQKRRLEALA